MEFSIYVLIIAIMPITLLCTDNSTFSNILYSTTETTMLVNNNGPYIEEQVGSKVRDINEHQIEDSNTATTNLPDVRLSVNTAKIDDDKSKFRETLETLPTSFSNLTIAQNDLQMNYLHSNSSSDNITARPAELDIDTNISNESIFQVFTQTETPTREPEEPKNIPVENYMTLKEKKTGDGKMTEKAPTSTIEKFSDINIKNEHTKNMDIHVSENITEAWTVNDSEIPNTSTPLLLLDVTEVYSTSSIFSNNTVNASLIEPTKIFDLMEETANTIANNSAEILTSIFPSIMPTDTSITSQTSNGNLSYFVAESAEISMQTATELVVAASPVINVISTNIDINATASFLFPQFTMELNNSTISPSFSSENAEHPMHPVTKSVSEVSSIVEVLSTIDINSTRPINEVITSTTSTVATQITDIDVTPVYNDTSSPMTGMVDENTTVYRLIPIEKTFSSPKPTELNVGQPTDFPFEPKKSTTEKGELVKSSTSTVRPHTTVAPTISSTLVEMLLRPDVNITNNEVHLEMFKPAKPKTTIKSYWIRTTSKTPDKIDVDDDKIVKPIALPLPLYITLKIKMTWYEYCPLEDELQSIFAKMLERQSNNQVQKDQIHLNYNQENCKHQVYRRHAGTSRMKLSDWKRIKRGMESIDVNVYVVDENGDYSEKLTEQLAEAYMSDEGASTQGTSFCDKWLEIKVHKPLVNEIHEVRKDSTDTHFLHGGIIAGIVLGTLAASCILSLVIIQMVVRVRRSRIKKMRYSFERPSVDHGSFSEALHMVTIPGRYHGDPDTFAYVNPAVEIDAKDYTSNPLSFMQLANFVYDEESIEDEFVMLPSNLPQLDDLPFEAEYKNRYANIVPVPATRVELSNPDDVEGAEYINANYIRGYLGAARTYIATQAPMENTIHDFWQMVWEQNTEIIIMLTALEEQGVSKCEEYWPNTCGADTLRVYGNYEILQQHRRVRPEWIQTTLIVREGETKQCREVLHFWLTAWPPNGLPDHKSVIKFVLEIRPYTEHSTGPLVVHCSSGTGRSGILLAIDMCMVGYVDTLHVDILRTVVQLRHDRAGMVTSKTHYHFIYKVLYEYAKMLHQPARISNTSSIASSMYNHQQNS